jgi:hypothetical protein
VLFVYAHNAGCTQIAAGFLSWVKQTMDYAVRIRPDLITGILLTDADQPANV